MMNQTGGVKPGERKKLLLHVCCASCAVYVTTKLQVDYEVALFFYNPNIQPEKEFQSRKKELERISRLKGWHTIYPDYEMLEWFNAVKQLNGCAREPERGKRCSLCFNIRLRKTFEYAKANGYHIAASTLSISPYKRTDQINEEGIKLSNEYGIAFLAENLKKHDGYNIAKKMAVELDIKHQNYCGCAYSKAEKKLKTRIKEKERQKNATSTSIAAGI
jgi:predicted adenine nucleotide alpha hydrolase (AANH) superfamily ATPase